MRGIFWRVSRSGKKPLGQSFVEFSIILPILLIMISGLIEFGFLLNYYLNLIDGARDTARFLANSDPSLPDDGLDCAPVHGTAYYPRLVQCYAAQAFGSQIAFDPATDDILVSYFSVSGSTVTTYETWSWYYTHSSAFTPSELSDMVARADPGNTAPDTGFVLVEVFYNYDMILALPWITAFVPNPMTLHAYTIMPNAFLSQ
jgi:hypothetical protein